MRLRLLPTMGRVWAYSAIRSQSGPCREVSVCIGVFLIKNHLICRVISFFIIEYITLNELGARMQYPAPTKYLVSAGTHCGPAALALSLLCKDHTKVW